MTKMQFKEKQWRERFNKFQSSGLTVIDFCKQQNVSVSSYYSWRTRLGLDVTPQSITKGNSSFVQVKTVNTTAAISQAESPINIQIGQVNVQLSHSTKPSWVAQLVREINA